jgi:hypothetical protein
MKAKLLKKLRKKYNWYFNKDGFPILIKHVTKTVIVYDLEYCCNLFAYTPEDLEKYVKVPHQKWALRLLKRDILTRYGYTLDKIFYRKSLQEV